MMPVSERSSISEVSKLIREDEETSSLNTSTKQSN